MGRKPSPPSSAGREPAPALEQLIARYRESGADEVAGWYEALLDDTPDAQVVRTWCNENARPNLGGLRRMSGGQDCKDWESELWALVSIHFVMAKPVSARERAGKKKRTKETTDAITQALALAAALEDEAGPPVPSVLALFGTDRAVDIIRAMPPERGRSLLRLTGYSADPSDGYQRTANPVYFEDGLCSAWQDPAANLARHFGGAWGSAEAAQLFPDLLRRLADYIEANSDLAAPRLKNPNARWADARAFAHQLDDHFQTAHGARPHAVIAALVVIKHPDLAKKVDAETIKNWLKHKPYKSKRGRSAKKHPTTSS